jgi:hypothetical protein
MAKTLQPATPVEAEEAIIHFFIDIRNEIAYIGAQKVDKY